MTILIAAELEAQLRESAAAESMSVDDHVARLIVEDQWIELNEYIPLDDAEFAEVQAAVAEGFEQIDRGETRPAEEVFAELKSKQRPRG